MGQKLLCLKKFIMEKLLILFGGYPTLLKIQKL